VKTNWKKQWLQLPKSISNNCSWVG
jgi:hypothetical protein